MSSNPLNKIAQHKLRPVDGVARTVTSKSANRNTTGSVKCLFCDKFIDSKKLRIHFRDVHPNSRNGETIVCEKCGQQFNESKIQNHVTKCQGDKEHS